ncbi:NAD(P)H-dependent flavin oxidoreductase [Nakamurella lactea]|uniref:NAD(P)H-dependent flavin oxidoreductase n=1 Tax=Nakamurella lactea TaxID=459515 RepID=UPI00048DB4DC|nr:nitronate monooxygenase [Nakamurella lactea]
MLYTWLTERLGIRHPVISASMTGVAHGRLARAVSRAGGLGMLGIGSQVPVEFLADEARIASDDGALPFGVGLTAWALPGRPELVAATAAQRPALVSLSFGPVRPGDVELLHAAGVVVSAQVHNPQAARDAVAAGVDLIEAQGTEAGGHTGTVAMLPLLQRLRQEVDVPVLAAGGIGTPEALAAVLVAGAVGARVGTPLLLSQEAVLDDAARDRLRAAEVDQTVLSPLFDQVLRPGWPQDYPVRTLANDFTDAWADKVDHLPPGAEARRQVTDAVDSGNYDLAPILAGQAVGLLTAARPAADVITELAEGAEAVLRSRVPGLLGER